MTLTRTEHTSFVVSDLDRSLRFYRDQLGFPVEWEIEDDGPELAENVGYPDAHLRIAQLLLPGGHRLELMQYLSPQGEQDTGERCDVGAAHLCLVSDDLAADVQTLRERGVDSFVSPPVTFRGGPDEGSAGIYLTDPDGITIELFQPA